MDRCNLMEHNWLSICYGANKPDTRDKMSGSVYEAVEKTSCAGDFEARSDTMIGHTNKIAHEFRW